MLEPTKTAEIQFYCYSQRQLSAQEQIHGTRMAIFTDVDDTTYSHRDPSVNGPQFRGYLDSIHAPDIRVTGRHFPEVIDYLNNYIITAPPPFISTRNGTKIYRARPEIMENLGSLGHVFSEEDYLPDEEYQRLITRTGFDKMEILNHANDLFTSMKGVVPNGWFEHQFADRPENLEIIGMTHDNNQVIFDIELPGDRDTHDDHLANIQNVATSMFPDLSVILMDNGEAKQGLLQGRAYGLFLLPFGIGKHTAIAYLMNKLKLSGGVYIGDQLNDLTALEHDKYPVEDFYSGIVGGSAQVLIDSLNLCDPRLINDAGNTSGRIGPQSALYIAQKAFTRHKEKYGKQ